MDVAPQVPLKKMIKANKRMRLFKKIQIKNLKNLIKPQPQHFQTLQVLIQP